jgi:transposase
MNTSKYVACLSLDWGDTAHAFVLVHGGSKERGTVSASAEALHAWLEQLGRRFGGQPVSIVVEAGRNAVIHALFEHPWLEVYPVHPAASARFRKALIPSGAKDDVPDAEILLTLFEHHRDRLRRLNRDSEPTRRLQLLVSARREAVHLRSLFTNQLRSTLKSHFPQFFDLIGDEVYTPLPLDFLSRWPSLAAVQAARPSTLRRFYQTHNSRRPALIEGRLACIASARPLTTDAAVIDVAIAQTLLLVAQLRPLQTSIEDLENRIAEAFAAHPDADLFVNLPGAGPALAPRLLAAFGSDRSRYPDAASLQKYSGVAPIREKSGKLLWVHWRWNCPKFLRQSFVEWVGQTVPRCIWAKAFYRNQQRAGKGHQAILRALAFKWIRILWKCWQDRTPYNETRYILSLHKRCSPLARACPLL